MTLWPTFVDRPKDNEKFCLALNTTMKRQATDENTTPANTSSNSETTITHKKKQKKTSDSNNNHTIPILRGKFKQRWLAKHSSLIKRSDTASGIMITCGIKAETRALVKKRFLDSEVANSPFILWIRDKYNKPWNDTLRRSLLMNQPGQEWRDLGT